jgi:hypothetical protein
VAGFSGSGGLDQRAAEALRQTGRVSLDDAPMPVPAPAPAPTPTHAEVNTNDRDAAPEIDLTAAASADSLKELGLERLKVELQRRGLKCGGTLEQRAERLFSVRLTRDGEVRESLRPTKKLKAGQA